ncbi:acetyl-CoA carboxylase biotin carboxyl carrier protein [Priestia flexa]|uniref:acetyl-CoA carboxylase biotin carboxyl carrier protein n=1 Tax=Priestia flexa TaxID=86664 RepID=UPI001B328F14|nr:acetyl-CoA carboxylase biotin carboxyl carrier protein [Priestia flexa]
MINTAELKEVISLMNEGGIQKLHVEHDGTKIVLDKSLTKEETKVIIPSKPNEIEPTSPLKNEEVSKSVHEVRSPMVGTFYSSHEQGASPFVSEGDKVNAKDIVCIVEAMKLFNEVEAGIEGEIVEILVKDGDIVEYDQPLFLIKQ